MSILCGLFAQQKLTESEQITDIVANRVWPLSVPEGADRYPFIVHETDCRRGESDKDEDSDDDYCTLTVYVVSTSYKEMLQLSNRVRKVLDHTDGSVEYDGEHIRVCECKFENFDGQYADSHAAYVGTITFEVETYTERDNE